MHVAQKGKMSLRFGLLLLLIGCPGGKDTNSPDTADDTADDTSQTTDTGFVAGPASCYIDDQFICDELTDPDATGVENLAILCSSTSGDFAQPAACPEAGFEGRCTTGTGKDEQIQRFYTGADIAYSEDFCVNTAGGAWSDVW